MSTLPKSVNISSYILSKTKSFRVRSNIKGLSIFLVNFSLYILIFFGTIFIPNLWIKLGLCFLNSVAISTVFIIGHDACHGSLTNSKRLNEIIGRLSLLPALHPYSMWIIAHNQRHHSWTNLGGHDDWSPLSKETFDDLSSYRKVLERSYRTPWVNLIGVGLYYLIEIYGKHLAFPRKSDWEQVKSPIVAKADYLIVIMFLIFQISSILYYSENNAVLNMFFVLILPYLVWNSIAGFITYVQHNHPQVVWFKNKDEWTLLYAQIRGTVHIKFPSLIRLMIHNISEHTAHHANTKIPLYNLPQAQSELGNLFPEDIVQLEFSITEFMSNVSKCQLYDYDHHCWRDFEGCQTTEYRSLIELKN